MSEQENAGGSGPGARWYIKKAARGGVAYGPWASGLLGVSRVFRRGPRVRALTYHRVGDVPNDPFCVHRDDFEAQIRLLAEERRAVSLTQVQDFVAGAGSVPENACLVTLDDGNISNLREALPILRRWGVPAVFYVTSSLVGGDFEGLVERFMTADELRELASSELVDIGAHARTHRSLGLMNIDEARDEAKRSKDELEDILGEPVSSFAYPFGTRSDFGPQTDRALADAGYEIAFNSMHGSIARASDPISLPRVKVEGGEPLMMFDLISRGAMDAWRAVDANLWRLQRVRQDITPDGIDP